jgi:hypothetical protein
MELTVKAILGAVSVAMVAAFLAATPSYAGRKHVRPVDILLYLDAPEPMELAQLYDGGGGEADAAQIAQDAFPRAKVLKVRLLRNGIYAVTLKRRGNVFRVLVDVETRSISRGL